MPFIDSSFVFGINNDEGKIHYLRNVLRDWPRNAICWTQLALSYSRLGVNKKAERCINNALLLAPNNRYVLRSASRFFVHIDEASHAAWVLRRSLRTSRDPWLMAAEISISQILDRRSSFLKKATELLGSSSFLPRSISELATSIGVYELESGSRGKARRNFMLGAEDPNGNVRAQLQWVRIHDEHLLPSDMYFEESDSDHEARALSLRIEGKWEKAISSCEQWGEEEFFSERPFCMGSYICDRGIR